MTKKLFIFSSILFFLISASMAQAASLYLKIDSNSPAETLSILALDTGTENINALEGKILYDSNIFDCIASPAANSIVNVWLTQPYAKDGEINLAGIIPGGFKGKGEIASIICTSKNGQNRPILEIKKDVFELLLNDGTGKQAKIAIGNNEIISVTEHQTLADRKIADNIPPEITNMEISKNTALAENNYLLIFNAVDKQTGVASIAMAYSDNKFDTVKDFRKIIDTLFWTDIQRPQVISGRQLDQYIYLKVSDQSGNIKLSRLSPARSWWEINLIFISIAFGLLILFAVIFLIVLKYRRK